MPDAVREVIDDVVAAVKPRLRGVLHGIAFPLALVAGIVLVSLAQQARLPLVVYAVAVCALFGTSALYHLRTWPTERARALMQRLDHSMIFVLIAGTYTPFAVLVLDGAASVAILGAAWGGAVAGIAMRMVFPGARKWAFVPMYLGLGWLGALVAPQIYANAGLAVLLLVAAGGVFYTAGAIVFATQRPNPSPRWFGFHEVFHALTIAAFITHYIAISLAAYRGDA